ncbi:hypothetical protein V5O48_012266 [Marasmius crinis-equi]|uniref:Uncharacterized protein n=1 Tax=Marasmius crinis-equi TaxID=585013 RepID=A0ABR3F3Q5_9AGAR
MTASALYVFCYPKALGQYRPTLKSNNSKPSVSGVYDSPVFIPGGRQQPPFPITLAAPSGLAHTLQALVQPVIDQLGESAPSAVLAALQSSDGFQSACDLMDAQHSFYYAMITAKSVLVHYSREAADLILKQTSLSNPYMQVHSSFKGAICAMITKGSPPSYDLIGKSFDDLDHHIMALEQAAEPGPNLIAPPTAPSTPQRTSSRTITSPASAYRALKSAALLSPGRAFADANSRGSSAGDGDDNRYWSNLELSSQELANADLSNFDTPSGSRRTAILRSPSASLLVATASSPSSSRKATASPFTPRHSEQLELELSRYGFLVRRYFALFEWPPKQCLTTLHVFDAASRSEETFLTLLSTAYPIVSVNEAKFLYILLASQKELE